jgi:hypothetical protein
MRGTVTQTAGTLNGVTMSQIQTGTFGATLSSEYLVVSSIQSSISMTEGTGSTVAWNMISDAVTAASTSCTSNCIYFNIKLTGSPQTSGSTIGDTFTVSGCLTNKTSIVGDGSAHGIFLTTKSCDALIVTVPTDVSPHRDRFNNATVSSLTWSFITPSTNGTQENDTYYYQDSQGSEKYSSGSGSTCTSAPYSAPNSIFTYLGSTNTTALTTSAVSTFWMDNNTQGTLTNPLTGSTGSARCFTNYTPFSSTDTANWNFIYYAQYNVTLIVSPFSDGTIHALNAGFVPICSTTTEVTCWTNSSAAIFFEQIPISVNGWQSWTNTSLDFHIFGLLGSDQQYINYQEVLSVGNAGIIQANYASGTTTTSTTTSTTTATSTTTTTSISTSTITSTTTSTTTSNVTSTTTSTTTSTISVSADDVSILVLFVLLIPFFILAFRRRRR